ncbi:MAG: Holliday junction resolvase RuvX [Lachnospiraceae bacterium]|nr:Holliday junction resolvase RuvX [Lachnospiraceae bacterium]
MRIMGLDYGSKTVGVAVSDPLGLTAQGVEIIRRTQENKLRRTLARIEELAAQYEVTEIVLGYPKNMNNTIGERAEKSLEFREMLMRRTGLPVVMWDERLTTVAADRTLMEAGVRRERRKEYVDMIAAVYILQGYLDCKGNTGNTGNTGNPAEAAEAEHIEGADRQQTGQAERV